MTSGLSDQPVSSSDTFDICRYPVQMERIQNAFVLRDNATNDCDNFLFESLPSGHPRTESLSRFAQPNLNDDAYRVSNLV